MPAIAQGPPGRDGDDPTSPVRTGIFGLPACLATLSIPMPLGTQFPMYSIVTIPPWVSVSSGSSRSHNTAPTVVEIARATPAHSATDGITPVIHGAIAIFRDATAVLIPCAGSIAPGTDHRSILTVALPIRPTFEIRLFLSSLNRTALSHLAPPPHHASSLDILKPAAPQPRQCRPTTLRTGRVC